MLYLIKRDKIGQSFFSPEESPFFETLCFQQPFRSWRKNLLTSTKLTRCLPEPNKVFLRFVMFGNRLKNCPKVFFHWKKSLSFKNLCFQQPPECYRNDLIPSTKSVKKPSGDLKIFAWRSSHSITPGKKAEIFCHQEYSLFLKRLFQATSQVLSI